MFLYVKKKILRQLERNAKTKTYIWTILERYFGLKVSNLLKATYHMEGSQWMRLLTFIFDKFIFGPWLLGAF